MTERPPPPDFAAFPDDPRVRVERAIAAVAAGGMVILVDDEDRENEGDLVMAADLATPEAINFMATHGRGLICLPMTGERIDRLDLPMMVRDNASPYRTAFTVSIEARAGVTTGISAADRARTILAAVNPDALPRDIVSPGHVFPLRGRDGGVLVRAGQTEGSIDLARLSGCSAAGVICEIMNEDGTMARLPRLIEFAEEHGLCILTVADIIAYRLQTELQVECAATARLMTDLLGEVTASVFRNRVNDLQYLALVKGDVDSDQPVLVRVHSSDVWTDALHAVRADGGPILHQAMRLIRDEECGVLLYIQRPFDADSILRGLVRHGSEVDAEVPERVQDGDPYPTALRDYGLGAQVLRALGVKKIRLITNSDRRMVGVGGYGLEVVERVAVDEASGRGGDLRALQGGRK